MICCIPTKGRPHTKTHKLFEAAGIETFHFVEPQEISGYKTQSNIVNINKDNGGVSYVRNFILDWANDSSKRWIIVCDDDVTGFGFYDGRNNKRGAEIWRGILGKAGEMPFEIVGINYRQHAWHEKTAFSINRKFVGGCAAFNAPALAWRYKENTKEDRDFVLQTIKQGFGVLRFNKYYFDTPVVGTNEGGLHENYAAKEDTKWAVKMVEAWHPYAKLAKVSGRIDAKVDIAALARAHGKQVK